MVIPVRKPADLEFVYRGQRHDPSVVPFQRRRIERHRDPAKGQLIIPIPDLDGSAVSRGKALDNAEVV